jgi:hypothetical protein
MCNVQLISGLLASCLLHAAAPPDPSLAISTKNNRAQFRRGEQIDVELRFETNAPGRYRLLGSGVDRRYVRQRQYESFTVEPADGAVDPLGDSGTLIGQGMFAGMSQQVLGTAPVTVPGIVNDWISFRRSGRYRLKAESERLFVQDQQDKRTPLQSNSIEIEIVPAEPEWQKQELDHAMAVLESAARGHGSAGRDSALRAARTLRYLETRQAVAPLARFYTMPLSDVEKEVRAALVASPYRAEVIACMDDAIAVSEAPITASFMGTLMQIEYARRCGAREAMTHNDPEATKRWNEADRLYMERFRPIHEQYSGKLAEAVRLKRGVARAVALEAVLTDGVQASAKQISKLLADELADLPAAVQARLLSRWNEIGGPELMPALRAVASKPGEARHHALARLVEIDPRGPEPPVLLELPDEKLPELDENVVAALDHGSIGPSLVARYASDAALPRVLQWLERNPQSFCFTAISAYFFRVDPGEGASLH